MSNKTKKGLLALLIIISIVIVAGAGGGYVYVGSNKFCGYTCHQMKTRAYIWQKSSHNQVKCITCHSEPGLVGEFKAHVDGINYLTSFIKGKTTHLTIFATRRNPARLKSCIYCHPADTLTNNTETLRIKHSLHIVTNEYLCTDCHEDMIHGTHSFETEMVKPQEKNCIACHLRDGARTDCRGCHLKKVVRGKRQIYVLEALDDIGLSPEEY